MRFLIESGANLHFRNEQGKDALEYAREFKEKFGDDTLYQYLCSLEQDEKKPAKSIFERLKLPWKKRN